MEQLSLLDLPPIPLAELSSANLAPKNNQNLPPTPDGIQVVATFSVKSVQWMHPQANRQTVLQGQTVGYWFRRGQRRTIGFSVGPQGLSVSAPRWTSVAAVEAALQAKAGWVLQKLAQVHERKALLQAERVEWTDGTEVTWLGGKLAVRVGAVKTGQPSAEPTAPQGQRAPMVQPLPGPADTPPDTLWVALPAHATPERLRDAVQAWMMRAAHAYFSQRLSHFAPLLGVRWTSLKLSSAATRWGSAKADGSIRLHWRLMQFDPAVVDYVVVHELAHLRHMDHSDRFWRTVASLIPDYAALRARLKGERLAPW